MLFNASQNDGFPPVNHRGHVTLALTDHTKDEAG
jgi:hypothetical protein